LLLDVGCNSHTASNGGKQIDLPTLQEFIVSWHGLLKSHGCKELFKDVMEESMRGYSLVRWWAAWMEFYQLQQPHVQIKLEEYLQLCITREYAVASARNCLRYSSIDLFCFVMFYNLYIVWLQLTILRLNWLL
jgi:hypothetical protein